VARGGGATRKRIGGQSNKGPLRKELEPLLAGTRFAASQVGDNGKYVLQGLRRGRQILTSGRGSGAKLPMAYAWPCRNSAIMAPNTDTKYPLAFLLLNL